MPTSIQPSNQPQSRTVIPFPPEVRNCIYGYVFSNPLQRSILRREMVTYDNGYRCGTRPKKRVYRIHNTGPDPSQLEFLLTSRAIYMEACQFWYHNELHFPSLKLLARFLEHIGPSRRFHVTNLSFAYDHQDTLPCGLILMKQCPNLKYLEILLKEHCEHAPPNLATLLEDVRGLHSVRFDMSSASDRWHFVCRPHVKLLRWQELRQLMMRPRLEEFAAEDGKINAPSVVPEVLVRRRVNGRLVTKGRIFYPWQRRSGWYRKPGCACDCPTGVGALGRGEQPMYTAPRWR